MNCNYSTSLIIWTNRILHTGLFTRVEIFILFNLTCETLILEWKSERVVKQDHRDSFWGDECKDDDWWNENNERHTAAANVQWVVLVWETILDYMKPLPIVWETILDHMKPLPICYTRYGSVPKVNWLYRWFLDYVLGTKT